MLRAAIIKDHLKTLFAIIDESGDRIDKKILRLRLFKEATIVFKWSCLKREFTYLYFFYLQEDCS